MGSNGLDKSRLVDDSHLGSAGEEDLAAAPAETIADDVGTERPDVLGARHGVEGQSAAAARVAGLLRPLEGGLHHAGVGDGGEGIDGDAWGSDAAQLPGEGGHDALGRAVATGVGSPPTRTRRNPEDAAVPGRRHERKRCFQHVEIAVQVHVEESEPVLLGSPGDVALPGDSGHVDHGIEPAMFFGQVTEERVERGTVGDGGGRGLGRAAGGDNAVGRRLTDVGQLRRALERDQRIDGDDEPARAAEFFGDGAADAAATARDRDHSLARAHDAPEVTSISNPSKCPSATHASSRSR